MADPLSSSELASRLATVAVGAGVASAAAAGPRLAGQHDAITANWFLGGRKVAYRFSVQLDEAVRQARFREASSESSWGIPPPTLTVEKTSQSGSRVSETRTDKGIGGGGTLKFGRVREAIDQATRAAGWQFAYEAGKAPE